MNLRDTTITKAQKSAKLKRDVDEFVANGGEIEQIPMGKANYRSPIDPIDPPKVFTE